jgi:3-polyprenyl-4-hydroxybenzoate decarboxylase
VPEEEFDDELPDLSQVPVMQIYEHHIVKFITNELIA